MRRTMYLSTLQSKCVHWCLVDGRQLGYPLLLQTFHKILRQHIVECQIVIVVMPQNVSGRFLLNRSMFEES